MPRRKSHVPPSTLDERETTDLWLKHKEEISQRAYDRMKAHCSETDPDKWEQNTLSHWAAMVKAYSFARENNLQRKCTDE